MVGVIVVQREIGTPSAGKSATRGDIFGPLAMGAKGSVLVFTFRITGIGGPEIACVLGRKRRDALFVALGDHDLYSLSREAVG